MSAPIVGLASVVLVLLLGQSRIFYAMAKRRHDPAAVLRDPSALPHAMARHHRSPARSARCWRGVLPLDILGELVSIGTLAAFVIVCAGIMILRVQRPKCSRPFRTPLVWVVAPLGIVMCLFMMAFLPLDTWIRLGVWTVIGLVIYCALQQPSRQAAAIPSRGRAGGRNSDRTVAGRHHRADRTRSGRCRGASAPARAGARQSDPDRHRRDHRRGHFRHRGHRGGAACRARGAALLRDRRRWAACSPGSATPNSPR